VALAGARCAVSIDRQRTLDQSAVPLDATATEGSVMRHVELLVDLIVLAIGVLIVAGVLFYSVVHWLVFGKWPEPRA
jgi:hypothetical protein